MTLNTQSKHTPFVFLVWLDKNDFSNCHLLQIEPSGSLLGVPTYFYPEKYQHCPLAHSEEEGRGVIKSWIETRLKSLLEKNSTKTTRLEIALAQCIGQDEVSIKRRESFRDQLRICNKAEIDLLILKGYRHDVHLFGQIPIGK